MSLLTISFSDRIARIQVQREPRDVDLFILPMVCVYGLYLRGLSRDECSVAHLFITEEGEPLPYAILRLTWQAGNFERCGYYASQMHLSSIPATRPEREKLVEASPHSGNGTVLTTAFGGHSSALSIVGN